jgi:phage N-6-adenine-methyltransferase
MPPSQFPKPNKSVHTDTLHNTNVLSLDKLRAEGKADAERIAEHEKTVKKHRKASLTLWFAQARRLWVTAEDHHLKGAAFVKFASEIGVDRSTAYELVKLAPRRADLVAQFDREEAARGPTYEWPSLPDVLTLAGIRRHRGRAAAQAPAEKVGVLPKQEVQEYRKRIEELETELDEAQQTIRRKATDAPAHIWQHGSDEWSSPQTLFDFLDNHFHFDVDVSATRKNAKCKKFWSKADDGLNQEWKAGQTYWMNPPYSQAGKWAQKASEAAKAGATVVGLFANRSASKWYYEHVAPSGLVVQLYGRLKYGSKIVNMSGAPFCSIVVIWPKEAGARIMAHCTPVSAVLLEMPNPEQVTKVAV